MLDVTGIAYGHGDRFIGDATFWSIVTFVTKLRGLSAEHYNDTVAGAPLDEKMESMNKGNGQTPEKTKSHGPECRRSKKVAASTDRKHPPPS